MNPLLRVLPTDRLSHGWQVLATLLAGASFFVLCWYLSKQGLLDLAATGLAFFVVSLVRQLGSVVTSRVPKEFVKSASMVAQLRADLSEWMANRKLLSHVLIALVATLVFLLIRSVAATLMGWIASPWLALAIGLAIAAAVASPVLVKSLGDSLRSPTDSATHGKVSRKEGSDEQV